MRTSIFLLFSSEFSRQKAGSVCNLLILVITMGVANPFWVHFLKKDVPKYVTVGRQGKSIIMSTVAKNVFEV